MEGNIKVDLYTAFISLRIGSVVVNVKVSVYSVAMWLLASPEGISYLVTQAVMR
jgi:hypothetical protein